MNRAQEVKWGESQERGVLDRWCRVSPYAAGVERWTKSVPMADYDFVGWSAAHIPIIFLEIKVRRSRWGHFGDVIFPLRKHKFAKQLSHINCALIGVTSYSCGNLVEVDLLEAPDRVEMITRKDRPNQPVRHVVYAGDKLTIYAPKEVAA